MQGLAQQPQTLSSQQPPLLLNEVSLGWASLSGMSKHRIMHKEGCGSRALLQTLSSLHCLQMLSEVSSGLVWGLHAHNIIDRRDGRLMQDSTQQPQPPMVFSAPPKVREVSMHQRMPVGSHVLVHSHGAQGLALLLAR